MNIVSKKGLKIPKGLSEAIDRRKTDTTIVRRKRTKAQTLIHFKTTLTEN